MSTLLLALLIFAMRVFDVTLGTLRIVNLVRGARWLAGALGFFESLSWIIAAGLVVGNLDSPVKIVAFAGGFATGTVLGSWLEGRIALGKSMLRIVTSVTTPGVDTSLRAEGYAVTVVNAEGFQGDVRVAFSVVPRNRVPHVLDIVRAANPEAFVTIEGVDTLTLDARRRRVRT